MEGQQHNASCDELASQIKQWCYMGLSQPPTELQALHCNKINNIDVNVTSLHAWKNKYTLSTMTEQTSKTHIK